MKEDLDKIKVRIKKLLALSKSQNENEAMAAMEKAQYLMEQHCLSASDCIVERYAVHATKRFSHWRVVLSNAVAWLYSCYKYHNTSSGTFVFCGESFDTFMAGELYSYLSKTIQRMAKHNIRRSAKKKYRDQYMLGVACELYERIYTLGEKASWAPQRGSRVIAARTAIVKEYEILERSKKITWGSRAFQKGVTEAQDISLARQTTGHGGSYIESTGISYT